MATIPGYKLTRLSPEETRLYANLAAFPADGAAGAIYIAQDTGKLYRWVSTGVYAELAPSPDEVQQYANLAAFPATGEAAALYIAADTGSVYRWDGAAYVPVGGGGGGGGGLPVQSTDLVVPVTSDAELTAALAGYWGYQFTDGARYIIELKTGYVCTLQMDLSDWNAPSLWITTQTTTTVNCAAFTSGTFGVVWLGVFRSNLGGIVGDYQAINATNVSGLLFHGSRFLIEDVFARKGLSVTGFKSHTFYDFSFVTSSSGFTIDAIGTLEFSKCQFYAQGAVKSIISGGVTAVYFSSCTGNAFISLNTTNPATVRLSRSQFGVVVDGATFVNKVEITSGGENDGGVTDVSIFLKFSNATVNVDLPEFIKVYGKLPVYASIVSLPLTWKPRFGSNNRFLTCETTTASTIKLDVSLTIDASVAVPNEMARISDATFVQAKVPTGGYAFAVAKWTNVNSPLTPNSLANTTAALILDVAP